MTGYLVLEDGTHFEGELQNAHEQAGEVVFNTSHSGYEEIATDPSYHNQIIVMTAPMMGNYSVSDTFWESSRMHIKGFVSLVSQNSKRDNGWNKRLDQCKVPQITDIDTRQLVLHLRERGTTWGAIVSANSLPDAKDKSRKLIEQTKVQDKDWAYAVCEKQAVHSMGSVKNGLTAVIIDYGCKKSIVDHVALRFENIHIVPSRATSEQILKLNPTAVILSNGPGDPLDVKVAVDTVREILGQKPIFGICMGHQILSLALGGATFKLKFGHRGANHPIKDLLLQKTYVTSQNHGYAVDPNSLPKDVQVTHTNLNDNTVAGIIVKSKKAMSVQFHPESHPGPNEASELFDYFMKMIL